MSEVIFTAPASGLYSYNEEIFFELSEGDKYVGLPKVQLDALRVRVDELEKENQKLKEALKVAVEAMEFAAAEDMWESDGEYIESFSYQYEEWYQDKLDEALSKIKALGIVKELC